MNKQEIWDRRFLEMAKLVSTWSKDPSTGIGAVIVNSKKRIVSLGFNGYPQGVKDEGMENREEKIAKVLHAEQNCMAFSYQDISGYTLYCTHCPCSQCAAMMIQRGISRVVFSSPVNKEFVIRWDKSNQIALELFKEAKTEVSCL